MNRLSWTIRIQSLIRKTRAYGDGMEEEKDPLDMIIRSFNERYFQGWDATPEEQRVKFVNIAKHMQAHPDFASKFVNNIDTQTRQLAFEKIFNEVMNRQRRTELDLYKQIAQDEGFKYSFMDSLKQVLGVM